MRARAKPPSPILGAASAMIDEASDALVTKGSQFRHSFEADMAQVEPDPAQPRKHFQEADIISLAATMREAGQLQPILLRRQSGTKSKWLIVAGERRWRAARLNGWKTILAIEHNGDPEVASLLENLQRVDLTPLEEARGLQRLIAGKKWSQDRAAEALGKAKSEISAVLRILSLPEDFLASVLTSELMVTKNALVELARIDDEPSRQRLFSLAKSGQLTIKAIRSIRAVKGAGSEPPGRRAGVGRGDDLKVPHFNFKTLGKIAASLREIRVAGSGLAPDDRAQLEMLRSEIDGLLG